MVRVVVLNWNAAWLTTRCVRSLLTTEYPQERLEIVVVDNASIDGSLQRLRADLDASHCLRSDGIRLRFIENEANLGFAEGCNRAMRDLDDVEFVALINNDAVVEPGWLQPLIEALDDPAVGAAVPKMLLESPFAELTITGDAELRAVVVDGVDVTRRVVSDDLATRAHPTIPLAVIRRVRGSAVIQIPVAAASDTSVELLLDATGPDDLTLSTGSATIVVEASRPGPLRVTVPLGSDRSVRINSLGTELKAWTEGCERWFGEIDRANLANHDTWGFSGGGVVLRAAMLDDVGLFDPTFFAYYEDTDLAWRAHAHGWTVRCAPESVVHHLHGGSAGPEAEGFFFLNYRNWLLSVARNATPGQMLRAAVVVKRLSWPAFRANVFGKLRRGRRPDLTITLAWLRVLAGVAARLGPTIRSRRGRPDTSRADARAVRSALMPATPPRAPRPRSGGPVLCYVDVTETLRSGWRAGIQRVVCEVVAELPRAEPNLELVLVCWSKVHQQFRRIDSVEYASLLAPTGTQQPAKPSGPPHPLRRLAAQVMHASGSAGLVYALRHRRELRDIPDAHNVLLLDRFEPGSVFLDIDATWNPTTQPRGELLETLARTDIHSVLFVHDLLPQTHPEWFIPQLVEVSTAHLDAHLRAGSSLLCNSHYTAEVVTRYAQDHGVAIGAPTVVPMGASTNAAPSTTARSAGCPEVSPDPSPYFLTVGTIEPRKNHAVILDAFAQVRDSCPEARWIVVGRPGWHHDAVTERLESAHAGGVEWRGDVGDAELDELYRGAHAIVIASLDEGFGLPVIEALQRGAAVLASNRGALCEAGGPLAEYFDPTSPDELAALMRRHLLDADHHRRQRLAAATYTAASWSDTARVIGRSVLAAARR